MKKSYIISIIIMFSGMFIGCKGSSNNKSNNQIEFNGELLEVKDLDVVTSIEILLDKKSQFWSESTEISVKDKKMIEMILKKQKLALLEHRSI